MFRSDIDALFMYEENFNLSYRSDIKAAHCWGHDGHIVSLLGFTQLFLENINKIPKNKTIRLIF